MYINWTIYEQNDESLIQSVALVDARYAQIIASFWYPFEYVLVPGDNKGILYFGGGGEENFKGEILLQFLVIRIWSCSLPKKFGVLVPLLRTYFFTWEAVWGKMLTIDVLIK